MKHINKLLIGLFVLSFASCGDPDLPYDEETMQNTNGAFLRTIEIPSGIFDRNDIGSSEFQVILEEFDVQEGGLLESVTFYVTFIDNTPDNGTTTGAKMELDTYPASQFSNDPDTGLPRITVTYDADDIMNAFGFTLADIDGGDVFRFEWDLNLTDGRTYNRDNSSNSVEGETFYNSTFISDVSVVCLLDDGFAIGDYNLDQTQGSADPFFGAPTKFEEGTVTLSEGSTPTRRIFDVNYISFALDLEIDLVCGKVVVPSQPAGVGCGGGIIWATGTTEGSFDPSDDTTIIINLEDDVTDDCGLNEQMQLVLTRI